MGLNSVVNDKTKSDTRSGAENNDPVSDTQALKGMFGRIQGKH